MQASAQGFPRIGRNRWRRRIMSRDTTFALDGSPVMSDDLRLFLMTFVGGFLGVTIFFA